MRPPQPDEDPRTDQTPEVGSPPTAPLPDSVRADGTTGDGTIDRPNDDRTTFDDRTAVDRTAVDRAPGDEPPTSPAPWRGAAQVPPPRPKQRWWQRDQGPAGPPPPRDPTLLLPAGDLPSDDPETRTPVDPWAGADPWPVAHPGGTHDDWAATDHPGYPPPAHPQPPSQPQAEQQQPRPPQAPPPQVHQAPPPPPQVAAPAPFTMPPHGQPARRAPRPAPAARPAPPAPPPPPAPKGPPPAARRPRRRRRWPTTMSLLTLLTVACCCGCPAYYGKPLWDQYPASPALPGQFADLRLSDDGNSQETVARLEGEMRSTHLLAEETFAGVYRDGNGKQVVLYGITGFRMTPGSDLDDELGRIADEYQLGTVTAFDTDDRGSHLNCGTGQADGTDVVVCVWADHGSLGTALFTRRSVEESAELTYRLRGDAISRQ
ncbi:hypothetical protein O7608_13555 [Solwaraspora sp. WMMA2056]|uniref:hypothetical protein n=1 Tax=Solwaraspora sp. WMMA2056 TaxID=3015161 RepID=UPI00259BB0A8|nr:hypothetical protein [Solwaraspora sp. WMMA2056]WJK43331.1 hypothetical protein O7608_13555 [Solwaraspora sp. WMMA2056]